MLICVASSVAAAAATFTRVAVRVVPAQGVGAVGVLGPLGADPHFRAVAVPDELDYLVVEGFLETGVCLRIPSKMRKLNKRHPSQIPLAGDFRPYFHIHDQDYANLVNKNPPKAGLILGVTNPFFGNLCKHWPHVLSVGRAEDAWYELCSWAEAGFGLINS